VKRDPYIMTHQGPMWGRLEVCRDENHQQLDPWFAAFALMRKAKHDLDVGMGRLMARDAINSAMDALDIAVTDMLSAAPWLAQPSIEDLAEAA